MKNKDLDHYFELVRDFHAHYDDPISEQPQPISTERVKHRTEFMQEELDEFRDSNTLEEQADAMIDLLYFTLGTLVEMGIKPTQLFEIVHNANMSKLQPDGSVRRDPRTGKVQKPTTWIDPEPLIREELERQRQKN